MCVRLRMGMRSGRWDLEISSLELGGYDGRHLLNMSEVGSATAVCNIFQPRVHETIENLYYDQDITLPSHFTAAHALTRISGYQQEVLVTKQNVHTHSVIFSAKSLWQCTLYRIRPCMVPG